MIGKHHSQAIEALSETMEQRCRLSHILLHVIRTCGGPLVESNGFARTQGRSERCQYLIVERVLDADIGVEISHRQHGDPDGEICNRARWG